MVLLFLLLSLIGCLTVLDGKLLYSEGFESKQISRIWRTDKAELNSLNFDCPKPHSGASCLQVKLRKGQKTSIGIDKKNTERTEIQESKSLESLLESTYKYSFNFLLPGGFSKIQNRLVLSQWKQRCLDCSLKRSPIIALRYEGGKIYSTISNNQGKQKFSKHKVENGVWHKIDLEVKFSTNKGFTKIFLNGVQITDFVGQTAYEDDLDGVYFKFGLYRDEIDKEQSIYFDDFSKSKLL